MSFPRSIHVVCYLKNSLITGITPFCNHMYLLVMPFVENVEDILMKMSNQIRPAYLSHFAGSLIMFRSQIENEKFRMKIFYGCCLHTPERV